MMTQQDQRTLFLTATIGLLLCLSGLSSALSSSHKCSSLRSLDQISTLAQSIEAFCASSLDAEIQVLGVPQATSYSRDIDKRIGIFRIAGTDNTDSLLNKRGIYH
ncbi:uncharacterized protein LOC142336875 isoform X1 [Convolutriloba macropyga]|uniref:uncharacterized protein LOC142336875 isoform X1 n=1 Tax=Convolutriloba macropyga TaxID=536237 RepID=UPI003F523D54